MLLFTVKVRFDLPDNVPPNPTVVGLLMVVVVTKPTKLKVAEPAPADFAKLIAVKLAIGCSIWFRCV